MRNFQTPGRSAVLATNGMCATSHPLAAKVAVQMLEAGGNAMDAALSGAVLLGLCEPHMTGIGGDVFALWSDPKTGAVSGLNGSGRAPAGLDADGLRAQGDAIGLESVHSVSMPGAVDAICRLAEHGRLGLKTILAPAIHYAEAGIPVAPRVAMDWTREAGRLQPSARARYLIDGAAPGVGSIFRAPDQAEVLRAVAEFGRDGFYDGPVAADIAQSLQALGGSHSLDDLAAVEATPVVPLSGFWDDTELLELPPNGQGATALLMQAILQEFDLASLDPLGADRVHLEAEATKLAYGARDRFIAEHSPDLDEMLAAGTASDMARTIALDRVLPDPPPPHGAAHRDTVYITVVDRDRMAVSLIYSIFHAFGSGIATERYGILMQNRAAGFTLEPGHPNEAAAGKRPLHTIIPAMLRHDGQVTMPFGVMGGAYQPCGHTRFVSNMTAFGMDPQSAIDAPRAFHEHGEIRLESGYSDDVLRDLADRGHKVVRAATPIGGAQAIAIRNDGVLEGASDARKDGCALGY